MNGLNDAFVESGIEKAISEKLKDAPIKRNVSRARKLLRSYSRLVGSQAPDTKTMQDLSESGDSIDKETLHNYLLALQRHYAVEELKAWNLNLISKTAIRVTLLTRRLSFLP